MARIRVIYPISVEGISNADALERVSIDKWAQPPMLPVWGTRYQHPAYLASTVQPVLPPSGPTLPPFTWFVATEQPVRQVVRTDYLHRVSTGPILPPSTALPVLGWLLPTEQPTRPVVRLAYLVPATAQRLPANVPSVALWFQQMQQPLFTRPHTRYLFAGGGSALPPVLPAVPFVPIVATVTAQAEPTAAVTSR